jgi:hypothetical protein
MSDHTLAFDLNDMTSEFLTDDTDYSEQETFSENTEQPEPDVSFVEEVKETPRAKRYRIKAKHGLNFLMAQFAGHPGTVADAAAIIEYGPQVSKAIGELADNDARTRQVIDFLTEDGIDNPYILTVLAIAPMAFQLTRNHMKSEEITIKPGIRIPFTKRRINLPFKFKLNLSIVKKASEEPATLTERIFTNPGIREALAKRDIKVAWQPNYAANGHKR